MANISQADLKNIDVDAKLNAYSKNVKMSERMSDEKNGTFVSNTRSEDGLIYSKGEHKVYENNSAMDNFEEFLKNKKEQDKQDGVDANTKERERKENAREIARSLSDDEIAKLRMMGIDVDSAKLSDIMSMVNTIRGNEHREKTAEMMAAISMEKKDFSNLNIVSNGVKVFGSDVKVENISVADVISEKLTDEASKKQDSILVSNDELTYILKNQLEVTKENIEKAHFSGSRATDLSASEEVFQKLLPQIEKLLDQIGATKEYEELTNSNIRQVGMEGAKFLFHNGLPVTADNLRTYISYQNFVGHSVEDMTDEIWGLDSVLQKADALYEEVASIDPKAVYDMGNEGRTISISSAFVYSKYVSVSGKQISVDENNIRGITAMRQMEEIRLSMTKEAAYRIVNADFHIDTRDLEKVVHTLKNMEQEIIKEQLKDAQVAPTEEHVNWYREMGDKIQGLSELPVSVLAAPLKSKDEAFCFSVNRLYMEAEDFLATNNEQINIRTDGKNSFEKIRQSYEAVGTAPRADMGDSIKKAFANVDDILQDLNMPNNENYQRAVRILGYNRLPVNEENILSVMDYDRQVTELMDTFYPEAVLSMIKDGVNPLDVPIEELNNKIRQKNYNGGVTDVENYATFLRDMEKQGKVSAEERESYIGIYRALNKLAKSGDREAGYLFANGANLTVRNLITAMRSVKAAGMDITLDENFGMLEELSLKDGGLDKKIDKQIEAAFLSEKKKEICDTLEKLENNSENYEKVNAFFEEQAKALGIEESLVNMMAVNYMENEPGGLYQYAYEILKQIKFFTDEKEDMIDEETENMTDSMLGKEVPYDFTPDGILEALAKNENMELKYQDLQEQVTEMLYQVSSEFDADLFRGVKTIQAGFRILGNMAQKNQYQVPVETEDGIRVMNVSIEQSETKKGHVSIELNHELYGKITSDFYVTKENELKGSLYGEQDFFNEKLQEREYDLRDRMEIFGLNSADFTFGAKKSDLYKISNAGEPKQLYLAAVDMVKLLGSIL